MEYLAGKNSNNGIQAKEESGLKAAKKHESHLYKVYPVRLHT